MPDPWDHSLEAGVERLRRRNYAERQLINAERPVAVLQRGGQSPSFITEHGKRRVSWLGGPGGGGAVDARIRQFHVLDAIDFAVGRAQTEEDLQAIMDRHVPIVGLLDRAIDLVQRKRRTLTPLMPRIVMPEDVPIYQTNFDPQARERLKTFEAAVDRRAQQVPALSQSRVTPRTRRRGGCRLEPIAPINDDPLSVLYCHLATGSPHSYRISIESQTGTTSAINRWAEIDALRGNTWYECKCGYEALLTGAAKGERVAQQVLDKLDRQVLNHLDIARTCGLDYRYVVSNERVADILRSRWFGNVTIVVQEFEGCD